jgi:predicted ATPase
MDTAREHHLPQWLALGERCMGWAMHRLGDFEAGLNLQQQGVRRWYDTGAMLHTTDCEVSLVESLLRDGMTAAARAHLGVARAHRTSYGEDYLSAEIDRLEGLLLQYEQAPAEIVEEYLVKFFRHSPPTRGPPTRTPHRHDVSARAGPEKRAPKGRRSAGSSLWLVRRGVRHRRSEGGKGAVG